jgi:acylphosphatase
MTDIIRLHINCIGKTQMVCFRAFTVAVAKLFGLSGTCENKETNRVEIFVEGDKLTVETFAKVVTFGPRSSRVDELTIEELPITGEIGEFHAIYPPVPVYPATMYNSSWLPGSFLASKCDICEEPIVGKPYTFYLEGDAWDLCKPCYEQQLVNM